MSGFHTNGPARKLPVFARCQCKHTLISHDYMYTLTGKDGRDVYRCRLCDCGKALEPQAHAVLPGETEEEAIMRIQTLYA